MLLDKKYQNSLKLLPKHEGYDSSKVWDKQTAKNPGYELSHTQH